MIYILDAAEEAGIDLPYSCRAGACSSCIGKIISGYADQADVTFVENPSPYWVFTCCAYPRSNMVIQTHVEDEYDGEEAMERSIEEQKRQEEARRTSLTEFSSTLFNGSIIPESGIHGATTTVNGSIEQNGNSLSVTLNAKIADPNVMKNSFWNTSYVEILHSGKVIDKSNLSIQGNNIVGSDVVHVGTANFNIPDNLHGQDVTIRTTVQSVYNSGSGHIPSVPRTVEQKIRIK